MGCEITCVTWWWWWLLMRCAQLVASHVYSGVGPPYRVMNSHSHCKSHSHCPPRRHPPPPPHPPSLSLGLGIIRGMVSACSNTTRLAVAVFSAAAVADVAAKTALWPHADPATLPAAAAVAAVLAVIAGLFSRGVLNAGGIASFQCWSAALARRAAQSPGPSFAEAYMMVEGRILAPLSALGLYLRGFWHILTFRGLLVYAASWVVSVAGAVAAFVVLATGRRIDLHPAWALAGIAWWAATRKTAMGEDFQKWEVALGWVGWVTCGWEG